MLRENGQAGNFRQAGDKVRRDAVAQIVLLRITTHIIKWKNGNNRRGTDGGVGVVRIISLIGTLSLYDEKCDYDSECNKS